MNQYRLMLFSPLRGVVSETFTRAHIELLPFSVIARFGPRWKEEDENGKSIWSMMRYLGLVLDRLRPELSDHMYAFAMARHLKKLKVNGVFAEYGTTGSYLVAACKRAQVPLFVHFHGYDASVLSLLENYGAAYRKMFDYADGIVVVSSAMKARLLALGADRNKLVLSPCGVDPTLFTGASPSQAGPVFVAVGRFVEKKAHYLTILAFSKVLSVCTDARLVLVGDGPLLGPCKNLVKALGIQQAVELRGACDVETVRTLLKTARCFVQHSLEAEDGDCEGTPVAVIEAQMAGLPVVATRHAGIPEVVIDGETGFIVEECDTEAMGRRMLQLVSDPELAGKLGAAGHTRASTLYTMDIHIKTLTSMIEKA